VARLTPRRAAAGLRRRLRGWSRRVRDALPRRHRAWRDGPASAATVTAAGTEVVVAETAELRRWLARQPATTTVRRLRIVVTEWRAPRPGWSGRLGPVPSLVAHHATLPASGRGRAEVAVELAAPVPLPQAAAAMLAVLEPVATMPRRSSPEVGVDEPLPEPVVAVDATTANPIGRRRYDDRLPDGVLHLATDSGLDGRPRWWVTRGAADPTPIVAGHVGEPLDARQRDVLASLGTITCPPASSGPIASGRSTAAHPTSGEPGDPGPGDPSAEAYASVLVQLAMTGVLLEAPHLPAPVAELVGPELAHLITEPTTSADPVERELRSVRQRRAALRGHATGLAGPGDPPGRPSRLPTVTALLLTRRPDRIATVLADLANQTYPELEIVVGLHGVALDPAVRAAIAELARPVEVVAVPADLTFGEALGEAMRWAGGSLLTKVDDDDRYGPEHVWDLVLARHYSGATVVGKGAEFVYLAPRDVTVRRSMASEVYDRYVAGGTLLISRGDLEAVGGWRPVRRSVDRALLDRVLAADGLVYRTHGFGYLYVRHTEGHTWEVDLDQFDRDAVRRWPGPPPYDEFAPATPPEPGGAR
jgi:hypothetical protein